MRGLCVGIDLEPIGAELLRHEWAVVCARMLVATLRFQHADDPHPFASRLAYCPSALCGVICRSVGNHDHELVLRGR